MRDLDQLRNAEFQRQISKAVAEKDIRRMIWDMREMVRMSDEAKAAKSYVVDEMAPEYTYIEKMRDFVRAAAEARERALGMLVIYIYIALYIIRDIYIYIYMELASNEH